jgi:branched-chain amino acid transport system ATP-binding protein
VEQHEIIGLIGPNGAGKSTLLNCINGIYRIDGGQILLQGKIVNGLKPYQITHLGVARTFQVPKLFRKSSLVENLMAPAIDRPIALRALQAKSLELLEYVGLYDLSVHFGEELSGGQQKLLEFARMLMFDPVLCILDEPFAGVHPDIKGKLHDMIRELHGAGKAFILVSHELDSIYALSTKVLAMHNGQKIFEGTATEMQSDHGVIEAYLGGV